MTGSWKPAGAPTNRSSPGGESPVAGGSGTGKPDTPRRLPLWLKAGFTVWVAIWAYYYAEYWGFGNFLWFCDIGNFMIATALWFESRLIISWQAVSVLLIQILYTVDVAGAMVLGFHPIGGTEYLFDPARPLGIRLLALYHLATPPLLIWCLARHGYDRRALTLQTVTAWIVLPVCYFLLEGPTAREPGGINWVWGPFGTTQEMLPAGLYLVVCMLAYPLLIYVPTHLVLGWWPGERRGA